ACSGVPVAPAPRATPPAVVDEVQPETDPTPLGELVELGWDAWERGDREAANRAFGRAVRAGVRAGTPPEALPLSAQPFVDWDGTVAPLHRIAERTLLAGAK